MPKIETVASIKTKFHPPTNHRGPRYSAEAPGPNGNLRRILVIADLHLSPEENHHKAAQVFADKFFNRLFCPVVSPLGYVFENGIFWTWKLTA